MLNSQPKGHTDLIKYFLKHSAVLISSHSYTCQHPTWCSFVFWHGSPYQMALRFQMQRHLVTVPKSNSQQEAEAEENTSPVAPQNAHNPQYHRGLRRSNMGLFLVKVCPVVQKTLTLSTHLDLYITFCQAIFGAETQTLPCTRPKTSKSTETNRFAAMFFCQVKCLSHKNHERHFFLL